MIISITCLRTTYSFRTFQITKTHLLKCYNHTGAIHSLLVSPDDLKVVTTSIDKMIKFFEILSFDMSHMISTEYVPTATVWLSSERGLYNRVGVADQNSGLIRIYRADGGQTGVLSEIGVHTQPVK